MKQEHTLIAVILSGIGASLCCVAPLVFVMLGIGGAWVGGFTAMEPYRPLFVALTLIFLGMGFLKLYISPRTCEVGKPCSDNKVIQRQRLIFWLVAIPVLGLISFPWFAPLLY
ncbi:MAG: mercuric transporter MerT family protein [Alphaproteobacteria bacterium]|nr:mercuric transporter MerT family protein [Alphaproteobacteria bacterium]